MVEENEPGRAARRFTRRAMDFRLLEPEEELELARRWREDEDEDALHRLTAAHIRLVVSKAARFRGYGLPMSDLVQEGNLGLMQAAARFDPDCGVRFSTYAAWWIRASMQDYVLRNWSIVRAGATAAQKALFFNLRRLRAQIAGPTASLSADHARSIAEKLGVPERDVELMAARMSAPDKSLSAPLSEDGDPAWQDQLADEGMLPDDATMARRDGARLSGLIRDALHLLDPRERLVVEQRRLGDEPITLEALGARLGVSKERVRQIEAKALEKMRKALLRKIGDPIEAGLI